MNRRTRIFSMKKGNSSTFPCPILFFFFAVGKWTLYYYFTYHKDYELLILPFYEYTELEYISSFYIFYN